MKYAVALVIAVAAFAQVTPSAHAATQIAPAKKSTASAVRSHERHGRTAMARERILRHAR